MKKSLTKKLAQEAIQEAINAFGSQAALAQKCGISQPNISRWLFRGRVPPAKAILIEKITGISRDRLNPDIFTPRFD